MKKISIIFLLFNLTSVAWTQGLNLNLANPDTSMGIWGSTAVLGRGGPSAGILLNDSFSTSSWQNISWQDRAAYDFQLPGLAFGFSKEGDGWNWKWGSGFSVGETFHLGFWNQSQKSLTSSGLEGIWRPFQSLSLAGSVTASEYFKEYQSFAIGLGIRPLSFLKDQSHRLTLTADYRGKDFTSTDVSLGLQAEAWDGVRLSGNYNFSNNQIAIQGALRLGQMDVSSAGKWTDPSAISSSWSRMALTADRRPGLLKSITPSYIRLSGPIALDKPPKGLFDGSTGWSLGTRELIDALGRGAADPSIKALVMDHVNWDADFAQLLEVRRALMEFKAKGKKILVYGDYMDRKSYFLAAMADKIALSPMGNLELKSFGTVNLYWKDFLKDWGIQFYNFRSHDNKTAGNGLSENAMTEAERQRYQGLFQDLQNTYATLTAEDRGEKLKLRASEILTNAPWYDPQTAKEKGLTDVILQPDQWEDLLNQELTGVKATYLDMKTDMTLAWGPESGKTVALIYAQGDILYGDGLRGRNIGNLSLASAIKSARENPQISGIILRVDSPGGDALASDLIAREVELCRTGPNKKPVVVSMGGLAASGGYYISAFADKIVASEVTLTGSIGVLALVPNFSGLLEKGKIKADKVEAGEGSSFSTPFLPMGENDKKVFVQAMAGIYKRFVGVVAKGRGIEESKVDEVARGQVWTGKEALAKGLVDRLGGLDQAIESMKELLNVTDPLILSEVNPGSMGSPFGQLFSTAVASELGQIFSPEVVTALEKAKALRSLSASGPLLWSDLEWE